MPESFQPMLFNRCKLDFAGLQHFFLNLYIWMNFHDKPESIPADGKYKRKKEKKESKWL